ncbi:hypothetical protein WMY93_031025 [Mugilogobius chulae]|uniref:ASD1 domain-containing protein n=1 Tax=Mugilogobius chulae TaxID=88201 RepID=A0AAW0MGN8_9GOBI
MVDFVAQKMPSENDVHVARSFLTKILRSSMRRNEPISRPHSWHSTKFNENQSEPAKTQPPPTQVWHTRYDASSSSADLTSSWEQTNLRRVSDQFSSLGSMDSLEHVPHPYPAGPLTTAKSNNSMEHLGVGGGGGKRDSAYSSFSTSSGTPDYTLSKSNAASTENVLYKVSQWDTGGKHISNRNNQSELPRQEDRVTYFQMPGCDGQHNEDQAGSRISTSSRSSFGPVWHVPEKNKKTSSPSPPPPAPPTRSDSFAATKQHSTGHFEDPHGKTPMDHRRSYNLSPKNDFDNLSQTVHKQHSSNVQPGHHSDKSTFYPQPWASSKSFSCSSQEMQSNGSSHQNHRRNLSTSSAITTSEQNSDHSNRYYCITPSLPNVQQPFASEDRRISTSSERSARLSPQTVTKTRYSLPPPQHATQAKPMEDRGIPNSEAPYMSYPANRTSEQRRSMPVQPIAPHQDLKQQVNSNINPKATPILHSLSMDAGTNLDDPSDVKNLQRSERFATTLRNAIQMRRAKLQKSQSAATLPANEIEIQEDQDVWKSAENATPTSNAYKDNLKEVQARVLKATSFRRRDLEPVLIEHPISELSSNYTSVVRKESNSSMPPVSESVRSKSGPVNVQVTRIGGRKRFSTEKKVKSFSEPDKIHHVGMKEDPNSSLDGEPTSYTHNAAKSDTDVRPKSLAASVGMTPPLLQCTDEIQGNNQAVPEHQRLGTFAEYEERWSTQTKPAVEKRASGRFRSADNILDHGTEERNKNTAGFHERSRSSPSADVYVQKFPTPAQKSEDSQTEDCKSAEQLSAATGLADRLREQPVDLEPYAAPPTRPGTAFSRGGPTVSSHKPTHNLQNPRKEDAGFELRSPNACQDPRLFAAHIPKTESEEQSKGLVDKGQGAKQQQQQQPVTASSHAESGQNNMETQRPPSPQFSPQKLSDKPPVSLHEDSNSNSSFWSCGSMKNTKIHNILLDLLVKVSLKPRYNCVFIIRCRLVGLIDSCMFEESCIALPPMLECSENPCFHFPPIPTPLFRHMVSFFLTRSSDQNALIIKLSCNSSLASISLTLLQKKKILNLEGGRVVVTHFRSGEVQPYVDLYSHESSLSDVLHLRIYSSEFDKLKSYLQDFAEYMQLAQVRGSVGLRKMPASALLRTDSKVRPDGGFFLVDCSRSHIWLLVRHNPDCQYRPETVLAKERHCPIQLAFKVVDFPKMLNLLKEIEGFFSQQSADRKRRLLEKRFTSCSVGRMPAQVSNKRRISLISGLDAHLDVGEAFRAESCIEIETDSA